MYLPAGTSLRKPHVQAAVPYTTLLRTTSMASGLMTAYSNGKSEFTILNGMAFLLLRILDAITLPFIACYFSRPYEP